MSDGHHWLRLEVRHLAALDAVDTAGSFIAAGQRLGYSQSAISLQIQALEQIAGTRLVERSAGRSPVRLTRAGEQMLRHAHRLIDQLRAAQADLHALATGDAGVVSLGTFQTASRRLLPIALKHLRMTHPQLEVRLHEPPQAQQAQQLIRGETDLALVRFPIDGPFETCELLHDRFVFVAEATERPALARVPSLAEIARAPLISWQDEPIAIESLLRSHGYQPNVRLRSDDSATVQRLVGAGLGVGVLPHLALDLPDPRLTVTDASRHLPPRRIGLAWHRDRTPSPGTQALREALQTAAAQLQHAAPADA